MRPATIEGFPGLDLRTDPADSKGAIDALNVSFDPGRVRTRPGSSLLVLAASRPEFLGRAPRPGGNPHLIAYMASGALTAFSSAGASIATVAAAAAPTVGATGVSIGTPTATYYYVGTPDTAGVIRRWDGAAWTAPAVFGAAPFPAGVALQVVGATTSDNRMIVCAGDRVLFSDPGAPETFGANNYVDLTPGDGESIRGVANFNNQTFIFKQTKFFVFYGQSPDGQGEPIFNYRIVEGGRGIATPSLQAVATGPDGVYFYGPDGIYRTTGGPAAHVSRPMEPLFTGRTNTFYAGPAWTWPSSRLRMGWVGTTLYASNFLATVAYDSELDAWSVWTLSAQDITALCAFPITSDAHARDTLVTGQFDGIVRRLDPALTVDIATAIVSRYRSAFNDFGSPQQKMIRETLVEGTGSPTLQWSRDWQALTTGGAVTLGTAPAVSTGRQSKALPGRTFSFQVGASSGAWAVHQIQPNVLESSRPVSFTT